MIFIKGNLFSEGIFISSNPANKIPSTFPIRLKSCRPLIYGAFFLEDKDDVENTYTLRFTHLYE